MLLVDVDSLAISKTFFAGRRPSRSRNSNPGRIRGGFTRRRRGLARDRGVVSQTAIEVASSKQGKELSMTKRNMSGPIILLTLAT
jgi:hypothetical protein